MPTLSPTILGNRLPINLPEPQKVDNNSWLQVSASNNFASGIQSNNLLYAWGVNNTNQVGDGTTLNKSSPTQISVSSFSLVSSGFDHSVALTTDNRMFTWGNQPSINSQTALSSWTLLSNGGNHILAVRDDGKLYAWGLNSGGQLGDNSSINKSSPVQIGTDSWILIAAGLSHSVGITSTGQMFAWGLGTSGQIGDNTAISKSSPTQVTVSGISSWTQVTAGLNFSIAIASDNRLYGWGLNSSFQLGLNNQLDSGNKSSPLQIGTSSWSQVSSGSNGDHTLGIDVNGNLYVWGNFNGAIAPNPTTIYSWTNVSAGNLITAAIRSDSTLWAWGQNNLGQLGQNSVINRSSPVQITAGTDSFTQVSVNYSTLLAIDSLGKLFGLGDNLNGQIGDNSNLRRSSPVQIGNSSWSLVNTGNFSSYGIDTNNKLYAWGLGSAGQIPTAVNTATQWSEIASSESHNVAISLNGNLYTWGIGTDGQLGLGDIITRSSPTLLDSGSWIFVHAAGTRSYAIRNDGRLYAWGQNVSGTLGDGTAISKSSPVQIPGSWTAVATGLTHTVGIKSDGSVFAWGNNLSGQLGNNSTGAGVSSPIAVAMPVGVSATMVKVGNNNTLVLTTTNALYTWGSTNNGIGLGDVQNRSSPTQLGSNVWTFIAARANAAYGITTTGELYGWGLNTSGDLGDNTAITKSSPVLVTSVGGLASDSYSKIYATDGVSAPSAIAITKFGTLYTLGSYLAVNRSVPTQVGTDNDWNKGSLGYGIAGIIKNNNYLYQFGLVYNSITVSGTSFPVLIGYDPRDVVGTNYSSPIQVGNQSWSQISAGASFALGISSNNKLFAWGLNSSNQLGDGTTISQFSPVQIGNNSWLAVAAGVDHSVAVRSDNTLWTWGNGNAIGLVTEPQSWLSVNAGNTHSLGIRNDGILYAWGTNAQGQLGDLTVVAKSSPVIVSTQSWSSVYAANSFSLAIDNDNKLFAWGINSLGQLGNNTTINKSSPTQISTSSFTMVAAGFDHVNAIDSTGRLFGWGAYTTGQTGVYDEIYSWSQLGYGIGLRADNTLWTWGLNNSGQIGDNTTINKSSPVQIGSTEWSSIALTYTTSSIKAAIKTNSTLFMWGSNSQGQLGLNDTIDRSSPVQVSGSWNQVSTQQLHTAARNSNNIIYTWGSNSAGELGDGTTIDKSSPVLLASPFDTTSWTSVSVGWSFTTALRNDNIIYTWGLGSNGRLGTGLTTNRSNPVTLGGAFATSSFVAVSAGALHALSIRSNGSLVTWGYNTEGALGDGTTIDKSTPVVVGASSWTSVAANRNNNYGVTTAGTLFFWGSDGGTGASGTGTTLNRSAPVIIGGLTTWSTSQINGAINNTGRLFVWGTDNQGILDTTQATSSPVQVGGFKYPPQKYFSPQQVGSISWNTVSAGTSYTIGIDTNNLLYGWGLNNSGQIVLGDLTLKGISSPIQLGSFSWTSVSAGFDHVLAIRNDTTLWTWGNSSAISLVVTPQSWAAVSAGASHTLAIKSDGALFAWGIGTSGQLGDGTAISKSSPVQIGLSSWSQVYAGTNSSFAIDVTNKLYAWGFNSSFQLGDTTNINKSSPVLVDSNSWLSVDSGADHTLAIRANNTLWGWGNNALGQILPYGSYFPTGYSTLAVGQGFTLGIRNSDGGLFAWGTNNIGQLGQGTTTNRSNPTKIGSFSWKQVSAANSTAMAIRSDDTLWGWGLNSVGQLGQGDVVSKSSPVQVSGSWTSVSVGSNAVGGIRTDGTLWMWGSNTQGELGDNTLVDKSSPVQLSIGGSWSQVSAGIQFFLARTTANIVYGWGNNSRGQLGDGTTVDKQVATLLASPFNTTSFAQVSAGSSHSLGLTTTGLLYSWGGNSVGELGNGGTGVNRSNPTQVTGLPILNTSYTFISAGGQLSGAINQNNLYVWGINTSGTLGTNDTINRSFPTQIGIGYSWTNIGFDNIGTLESAFLRSDNSLWTVGNNSSGNLGNNSTINRSNIVLIGSTSVSAPVQISGSWSSISAGTSFSLGINTTGQLYAWGTNGTNQIGNNSTVEENDALFQIAGSWTKVSAGTNHSLAIKSDSTLWTWGNSAAIILSNVTPVSWTTIAAGGAASHCAAIKSDGSLWTWGLNVNGQLGDSTTINKSSPTQIGLGSYSQVAVDISNTIAIRTGGNLFVWGGNASGQLGDGTTINKSSPVQLDSNSWSQIGINTSHAAAIRSGSLFTWGNNQSGQLGQGDVVSRSSPVQVAGNWNTVNAGANYTIAINNVNQMFAWGINAVFQLGDYTTINKSSPVQIASGISFTTLSAGPTHSVAIDSTSKLWTWGSATSVGIDVNSWTQVSFGNQFGLAIRSDSKLFAWGVNSSGQLGLNDTIFRSSPVLVSTGSWTSISASAPGNYSAGITSDGKLFAWGQNTSGQLGDNTTLSKSSPIQVLSGSSFTLVSAGVNTLFATTISPAFALFATGSAGNGNLGDGTTINKSSPVQITSPAASWTFINGGWGYAAGITSLGKLYMWGVNNGYLGLGDTINRSTPTIISGSTSWLSVSAGGTNTLAIDTTNKLWAWGWSNAGQLGDGTTINKSSPVQIGTSSWVAVAATDSTSMAIRADNTLWTWGLNSVGQLGIGLTTNRSSPVQVLVAAQFSGIAISGNNSIVAISTTNLYKNKLFFWGANSGGQLVTGDTVNRSSPTMLFSTINTVIPTQILSYQSFSQVSAGISYTLAKRSNDDVIMAWGLNTVGNYGDNTLTRPTLSNPVIVGQNNQIDNSINSFVPNTINGAPKIVDFSPFANTPYNTVTYGGSMQFSGNLDHISYATNAAFTFGTGNFTVEFWLYGPYQLNSFLVDFRNGANASYPMITTGVSIAALRYVGATGTLTGTVIIADDTWHHIAVTRESGTVKIWIDGVLDGTLADASNYSINSSVFFGVSSYLSPAFRLSGYMSNVRIVKGQALYTTTFTPSTTPLTTTSQNAIESNVSLLVFQGFPTAYTGTIAAVGQTSLFGNTNNDLYVTGLGASGQQGDGTTVNKSNPVQLGSVFTGLNTGFNVPVQVDNTTYSDISASLSFSLALSTDTTLFAWGLNTSGQFGLNLTGARSSPTQIGALNQTFVDNSTFGYSLTYGGATQMVQVVPFASYPYDVSTYGASQLFNGSPDYLELSYSTAGSTLQFGTDDFTIELWFNGKNVGLGSSGRTMLAYGQYVTEYGLRIDTYLGQVRFLISREGISSAAYIGSPVSISNNTWYHAAIVRISGVFYSYLNGTQVGTNSTYSANTFDSTFGLRIGCGTALSSPNPAYYWGGGYISNVRVVKGVAVYTGNFTVPTLPLSVTQSSGTNISAITGTQTTLLTSKTINLSNLPSYTKFDAGGQYTTAIDVNTSYLYTWGGGTVGQLGIGDAITRSSPVLVGNGQMINTYTNSPVQVTPSTSGYTQVYAGQSFSMAKRSDNSYFVWGLNTSGQLGLNDIITRSSPTSFGTSSFVTVSAGYTHLQIINATDNLLYATGLGTSGQLGLGLATSRSLPTIVGNGQVINTGTFSPIQIGFGLTNSWTSVSAGQSFSFVKDSIGSVYVWGLNSSGQLNNASTINRSSPTSIAGSFNLIAAGLTHTVATLSDSTLYTWGLNNAGNLGDNTAVDKSSPVLVGGQFNTNTISPVLAASASWTSASAGTSHSLAIKSDGTLWAWGLNASGQLGQSDTINRSSITQIGSGFAPFVDSSSNGFALTSNNNAYMVAVTPFAVGSYDINTYGGSGSFSGADPYVTTSNNNAFDLPGDFTLECWVYFNTGTLAQNRLIFDRWTTGISGSYQLYYRLTGTSITFLVDSATILLQDPSTTRVTTGTWYHIAIVRNGSGSNNMSMYIDGISVVSATYTNSLTTSLAVYIGIQGSTLTNDFDGYISNLRLVKGVAVYTGNFTPSTTPLTNITGTSLLTCLYSDFSNSYNIIKAGNSASTAIKANGLLYGWGLNTTGQLGLNVATNRSAPVQITTSSWSQVSTGLSTTIGINSDGNLYAWGNNATGQLASSVVTPNRSSPTIVAGVNYITNSPTLVDGVWSDASAGLSHTGAISSNTLYMWGLNTSGQLGLNDVVARSSPTTVGSTISLVDESINSYTVSLLGGASINTTVVPYIFGTFSVAFNLNVSGGQKGVSDHIRFTTAANTNISGYTNYTVEMWIYQTAYANNDGYLFTIGVGGSATYGRLYIDKTDDSLKYSRGTGGWSWPNTGIASSAGLIETNVWRHIALVKEGSSASLFYNGNRVAYGADPGFSSYSGTNFYIGTYYNDYNGNGAYFRGYISNFRMNSTALYSGTTYTIPTSVLTPISNTQLLIIAATPTVSVFEKIYAGSATTYTITENKNMYAWGLGTTGQISGFQQIINRSSPNQIGNNYINVNPSSPVQIAAGSWTKVAAGNSVSAAIRSDGLLFTWGSNAGTGTLGTGNTIARSSPVQVGNSSWTQVSVYFDHMAALTAENSLYMWGTNTGGQLGQTDTINRSSPVLVGSEFIAVLDVSNNPITLTKFGSSFSTTIVPLSGSVSGVFNGNGNYLQGPTQTSATYFGTGSFTIECWIYLASTPTTNAAIVSVNGDWQLSWGAAYGFNYMPTTSKTTDVSTGVLALYTWYHIALVRDASTTTTKIFVNGVNTGTNLTTDNANYNSTSPVRIGVNRSTSDYFPGYISNLRIVRGIAVYTANFTVPTSILTATQSAGTNIAAITGNETYLLTYTTQAATIVGSAPTYFNSIAAGASFTGGVTSDNLLFAWGFGTSGQLGYGTAANRSSPVQIGTSSWTIASAGNSHFSAIRSDGYLYNWGLGTSGQLGQAYSVISRSSPTQLGNDYPLSNVYVPTKIDGDTGTTSWSQISAGNSYSIAIKSDNLLFAWGLNNAGQLGNNSRVTRSSPSLVTSGTFSDVSAGNSFTGALAINYPTGQ